MTGDLPNESGATMELAAPQNKKAGTEGESYILIVV